MNTTELIEIARECGWLRAIDEALVMHDVGVANADDDYATAKDKLNKLLCVVQDIGAYFAKQESAQSAAEPVSTEWESLRSIGDRLHNISVEQHYAGNEKLSTELGEFASLLWIWERTRAPTVPPASRYLLLKIWDALNEECAGKCNAEHNPCWARQLISEIEKAMVNIDLAVPPTIVEQIRQLSSEVRGDQEFQIAYWHAIDDVLKLLGADNDSGR